MAYKIKFGAEPIRQIDALSITAFYTAVGPAVNDIGRMLTMINTTDVDLYVSLDGVTDNFRFPKSSSRIYDISANQTKKDNLFIKENQVFYVRAVSGLPSSGAFWIEVIIGE